MKKNIEKTLLEMFGDPIDPVFGTKVGDMKDIKKVGAVGVRDMHGDELGEVCQSCGMMSIDGVCDCDDQEEIEVVDLQPKGCSVCGMMSTDIDNPTGCGMNGEGCRMDEKSCS